MIMKRGSTFHLHLGAHCACGAHWHRMLLQHWAVQLQKFYYVKLAYLLLVSLVGAALLCRLEGAPFLAAWFQAVSAVTSTGQVALDMSTLSRGSQVVMLFIITAGGGVLGSVAMPLTRWWHVRRALAAHAARAPQQRLTAQESHMQSQLLAGRELLCSAQWAAAMLVLAYWAAVQLAAFAVLAVYSASAPGMRALLAARGVDPLWFAAFHAVSAFTTCGFTLFTDNLVPLAEDRAVLLALGVTQVLGNVGAPVALRGVLRAAHALFPRSAPLSFLLRHPRVAFYNVFDARATAQLAAWLVLFTV